MNETAANAIFTNRSRRSGATYTAARSHHRQKISAIRPIARWPVARFSLEYWLPLLAFTLLLLSRFGIALLTIQDNYLVEVVLAALVIYISQKAELASVTATALRNKSTIAGIGILLFLSIEGAILHGGIKGAYADLRSCALLWITLCVVATPTNADSRKAQIIVHIVIAALIFDVLYGQLDRSDGPKKAFNLIAASTGLYISARSRRFGYFLIVFFLGTFLTIQSGYRSYWLVFFFSAFSFSLLTLCTARGFRNIGLAVMFVLSLGTVSVLLISSGVIDSYLQSSESRYIQSIGKSNDLINAINGNTDFTESDELRAAHFAYPLARPFEVLLPHGLNSRDSLGSISTYFDTFAGQAFTGDSGFLFVVYHFGVVLTGAFILWYHSISSGFARTHKYNLLFRTAGILVFCIYLAGAGDLFLIVQRGIFAGMFLGVLANPRVTLQKQI